MQELFYVSYGILFLLFIKNYVNGRLVDHVFMPWPSFPLMFSTYFLLGSLIANVTVSDLQWGLYILAILGFWLGYAVHGAIYKPAKIGLRRLDQSFANKYFIKTIKPFSLFVVFAFCLGVTFLLWQKNGIPFLSENVDKARMTNASNGYLATLATAIDVVTVFFFCLLISSVKEGRRNKILLCAACVSVFILVAVLSGSRSRIFKFIVPCVVVYHFVYGRLSLKFIAASVVVGGLLIGLIGYYRAYALYGEMLWSGIDIGGSNTVFNAIVFYMKIELSTAVYGLSVVLNVIPQAVDYTYGVLFFSPLLMPLPISTPTPGMFYKEIIGGTWDGAGLAATFIAPMYTDLSVVGVVIQSAFYSFWFNFLYSRAVSGSLKRNYFVVTYAVYYFFMISGVRSDFVSFEFLWFLLLTILVYLFARKKTVLV